MKRTVCAAIVAAVLCSGCGPKAITVGSRPFPSEKPLFTDASGKAIADLPGAEEQFRVVVLDSPWCPACGDAWDAVRDAAKAFPPGTLRLYRVQFDREVALTSDGRRETAPFLSTRRRPDGSGEAADAAVTTLTALPGSFRDEYRVRQVPVILLLSPDGTVERRWTGFSTGLSGELSREIRKRSPGLSPLPPGT